MMRILLLGAAGQVGFALRAALAPLGALTFATRTGELVPGVTCECADLADNAALRALLDRMRPDLIVNAAAYTAVDRAEQEPELAQQINADAVAALGIWAAEQGACVLHYSTDYVFGGDGSAPYRESDPVAPLGAYGRSKRAGEEVLAASGADHLILRTAWVYAARGHNFLCTMLRLARERDSLGIVGDQFGAPTPAALIAAATATLLARRMDMDAETRRARSGIYHLTSAGQASWFEFAAAIFDRAHAVGLIDRIPELHAIATEEYPTPARRPGWSVLDCSRVQQDFGLHLPLWQQGLDGVMAELATIQATTC